MSSTDPIGNVASSWRLWPFGESRQLGPGSIIRISGSYRIVRLLGRGGMGAVYLVEKRGPHDFSKLMAIKVLPKDKLPNSRAAVMFLDEARLTANLIHPYIIQVYQLGITRYNYLIVMEHVFGVTLLEFLNRHTELGRPVPLDYGLYIMTRVLAALHYAHNKHNRDGIHLQIVHRDVCPSNILISFRGVPKLSDFGVAKAKTSNIESEKQVTVGKYPYMSPEQVRREGTDARSDIYAVGLVMYELFTGKLVHEVSDTKMLLDNLEEKVPPPELANAEIPKKLSDIIMKAIHVDRDARYQSAKQMRLALEEFMLGNFMIPDQDGLAEYLTTIFPQAAKHRWW